MPRSVTAPPGARQVAALLLALLGLGFTPHTQAAPPAANVNFYLEVRGAPAWLCTGSSVKYSVFVYQQFTSPPPGWTESYLPSPSTVVGAQVQASLSDSSLGSFTDGSSGWTGMSLSNTSENVNFTFKAGDKPGALTLTFKGTVENGGQISVAVPLKIVVCAYEVTVISNWFVTQGTGGSIAVVALIHGATLALEDDDMYSGITLVTWVPAVVLPAECNHDDSIASTAAHLKGYISDDGVLSLEVTYDQAVLIETGACPEQEINTASGMTAETLRLDLPGEGGTMQADQELDAPELIPGSALIVVRPVGQ